MTAERTCDLEPFSAQIVAQVRDLESAGSALQLFIQQLEGYLARFKEAVCDDFIEIVTDCCGGGPTAISFLDLTDTPASYVGSGGYAVAVNGGATGLEFVPFPTPVADGITSRLLLLIKPSNISLAATAVGNAAPATTGTFTGNVPPSSASVFTNYARINLTTAAGAGSQATYRSVTAIVWRGNAANLGGFRCVFRFGFGAAVANQRSFVGLKPPGAIGNVNPSTFTDCFGVGYDAAATVLSIMHNDAAGAATDVPLGASFPVAAGVAYEAELSCDANSGTMEYVVTNLGTGAVASGSINTELPTSTTFLDLNAYINNGATVGGVTTLGIVTMLAESAI